MTSKKTGWRGPRGFTLIELLVVIAIIGILMGLVVPKLIQMMGSSREHRCRNNLRQLQAAFMNYVQESGGGNTYMPNAMSYETYHPQDDKYRERRGWVGWVHRDDVDKEKKYGKYWPSDTPVEGDMVEGTGFGLMEKECIENGVLYTYVNNDIVQYACPVIKRDVGGKMPVYRTYAMNVFFSSPMNPIYHEPGRWFKRVGTAESEDFARNGASYNTWYCPEPAKLLLFAEVEPELNPAGGRDVVLHPRDKSPGRLHYITNDGAKNGNNDSGMTRFTGDCCFNPPLSKTQLTGGDTIFCTHKGPTPHTRTGLAVMLDGSILTFIATATKSGTKYNDGNNGNKNYAATGSAGKGRFSATVSRPNVPDIQYNVGWYLVRGLDPNMDVN